MRQKRTAQASIYELFADHDLGRELESMSAWLDGHRSVLTRVMNDLCGRGLKPTGRRGLSAKSALRCAILKQHRQLSYEELAFHLQDSASFQAFARLPGNERPKKSTLQRVISAIQPSTWEFIHRTLMSTAQQTRIEPAQRIRIDSTVTDSPIHAPSDSHLLWDGVRVLVRLLKQARELPGAPRLSFVNHQRLAKKRARALWYTRGAKQRRPLYRDLIATTRATLAAVSTAREQLLSGRVTGIELAGWLAQVEHYETLVLQVISQTERRVFGGEKVPANEKCVSLFKPHTDIIVKGARDVQYGHKLNLSSGRSGLILDLVIEQGNPVDSQRFMPMLERHRAHYGAMPRQVAADGGYASPGNLQAAKAHGVEDIAFHKKRGLAIADMVKSQWVYRRLRNFRAGIEAGISCLKRAYGLARCTWKGLPHFEAYVWSSVVAYNLSLLARYQLE
ncbi:MAG: ISNCY family transposase [Burkholderiaceae bacterium]|nr:ISNCY family transposase [Burkholderiaceae bacterium]